MKRLAVLFSLFSFSAFSFEGIITFTQTDYEDGKKIPSITKTIKAYFQNDFLVRITQEYDGTKIDRTSDDIFISHSSDKISILSKPSFTYRELVINKKAPVDTTTIKLGKGDVIVNNKTTIFTFPENNTQVKTYMYYADDFKVKPQPYLIAALGSIAWAVHPETGAVSLKTYLKLSKLARRYITATAIDKRDLKPEEYIPLLSSYKLTD